MRDVRNKVLVVRPSFRSRGLGWLIVLLGVVLGLSAFAGTDLVSVLTMAVAGLILTSLGASIATALLRVTPVGLHYRHGRTRQIPAEHVAAVRVGRGSGAFYSRISLIIDRRGDRSIRLTALQRAATPKNRRRLEERAEAITAVLGLAGAGTWDYRRS